jgi:hypothetical protein
MTLSRFNGQSILLRIGRCYSHSLSRGLLPVTFASQKLEKGVYYNHKWTNGVSGSMGPFGELTVKFSKNKDHSDMRNIK